jgi:hypothetical protein
MVTENELNSEKNEFYSFRYFLGDKNIEVCQKKFLNTLGLKYNSKINNLYKRVKIEENIGKSLISASIDKRRDNKFLKRKHINLFNSSIIDFIKTFKPKPSHYNI